MCKGKIFACMLSKVINGCLSVANDLGPLKSEDVFCYLSLVDISS